MDKTTILTLLAFLPLILCAQSGEILSFKVNGLDYYPSGPKLNTTVTVRYSHARKAQLDLVLSLDNGPLPFVVSKNNPYGVPTKKYCGDFLLLNPTNDVVTKTYTFLIPIKYKRLTNGQSNIFYVSASLLDTDNIKTLSIRKQETDISKLKVTTHQESMNSPQEKAKRKREYEDNVKSSEQLGQLGGLFAGALLGGSSKAVCSNCNGAGCSVCDGTGYDNVANDLYKSGYEIGQRLAKNSKKGINGIHTVTFKNGKYTGTFQDGLCHGKGTFIFNNGEKYVGDWEYGKMTGMGTYTLPDGSKYVGEFVNDIMCGNGEMYLPDGDCYKGWFENGEMSGMGTMYYAKYKTYIKGFFENGDLVKEIKRGLYSGTRTIGRTKQK